MSSCEDTKNLLYKRFGKLLLTKSDLAEIYGVSLSTIDKFIKKDFNIPPYLKFGEKNSKSTIRFSIEAVSKYLCELSNK